ncbi:hypothetical protein EZV62_011866 [Acer yangbiense]|uniref:RRM domain-containing protein n=1 Tax=Acer yangbiense TaxID=1000413 RepID=A0A5C7I8F3_9ROSI|nr:hypothetical protein EZV62_011866 [Acer yangbiense]
MDFDEYEYLENTVENPEPREARETVNGDAGAVKSEEKERSRSSKHKRDEKDDNHEDEDGRHSKHSKSRDETRDHDRRKERGSSRHRSRSREGERDRHRSSREHKDRERDRDREREERNGRDRGDKERDRDRKERDRDSGRERGRDKEKEREPSRRSGSRSERHRTDRDEREKSRDRENKEKEPEREFNLRDRNRDNSYDQHFSRRVGEGREVVVSLWGIACQLFWELADSVEQSSDGPSGNWARHRNSEMLVSNLLLDVLLYLVSVSPFFIIAAFFSRTVFHGFGLFTHSGEFVMLRHKEKKEDGVEPEADPERDQRTVFAYQISLKADERHVYEFFSRAGKVRDVRLIMDRISRRSKGVGYVEFYDVMSVPMAIALSGQPLLGQPVMVKPSEAEKNLVQSTTSVAGASGGMIGPYSGGARRLYVGNLHFNMTEDQLRQVFEPFGTVELVQLPFDDTGHCKGFGFVQFARLEDARNALNLNGQLEIAGRAIKVSAVTDQIMLDIGTNAGDFDDDEGGGLSLNARSRALLMQKLDRSGSATAIPGSLGTVANNITGIALPLPPALGAPTSLSSLVPSIVPGSMPILSGQLGTGLQVPTTTFPTIDAIGIPSECVLLKNMFDPTNETYEDFDMDIKEDVEGECSKFGKVKHIYVEKNSAGFVYLRFENAQSAASAQQALHGRWFAGKMITATFMVPETYEAKFPDSR